MDRRRTLSTVLVFALGITAQPALVYGAGARPDSLADMNNAVRSMVDRVSRSVVQVLVTSYGTVETDAADADRVLARRRSTGSGVAIDSDGYIVTNAHVVANALTVQVVLPGQSGAAGGLAALAADRSRTVDARIVGVAPDVDLALLKVAGASIPPLPIADYDALRQGDLVFAFGSPEGFRNSVTMGVVSAVARQSDPDNAMVYVQTDAPINHGNSGGPLVNIKGELVGINTFILSDNGSSQGLGFAIPGALVQLAYPQLRQHGRAHRAEFGILLQTITPTLAAGLGLAREEGVMISDVAPDSPAASAGLRIGDIVAAVDGTRIDSLPRLAFHLFTRNPGDRITINVLRGRDTVAIDVVATERDMADCPPPLVSLDGVIPRLGIVGIDVNDEIMPRASTLRERSGVLVVGRTEQNDALDTGLTAGDTIHRINHDVVKSVTDLRRALDALKSRSAVVLQIERNGRFTFLAFEVD